MQFCIQQIDLRSLRAEHREAMESGCPLSACGGVVENPQPHGGAIAQGELRWKKRLAARLVSITDRLVPFRMTSPAERGGGRQSADRRTLQPGGGRGGHGCVPVFSRSPGRVRAQGGRPATTFHLGQRLVAQGGALALASLRAGVFAGLLAGLQSDRAPLHRDPHPAAPHCERMFDSPRAEIARRERRVQRTLPRGFPRQMSRAFITATSADAPAATKGTMQPHRAPPATTVCLNRHDTGGGISQRLV